MNYIGIISLFTLFIFNNSCKSRVMEKAVTKTNTEVMKLHDETMIAFNEIANLADQLKKKAKDTTLQNLTEIDSIRTELDGSNEEMTDWMANYQKPITKDDAALKYLIDQVEILTKMKENQKKHINAAKELLTK